MMRGRARDRDVCGVTATIAVIAVIAVIDRGRKTALLLCGCRSSPARVVREYCADSFRASAENVDSGAEGNGNRRTGPPGSTRRVSAEDGVLPHCARTRTLRAPGLHGNRSPERLANTRSTSRSTTPPIGSGGRPTAHDQHLAARQHRQVPTKKWLLLARDHERARRVRCPAPRRPGAPGHRQRRCGRLCPLSAHARGCPVPR